MRFRPVTKPTGRQAKRAHEQCGLKIDATPFIPIERICLRQDEDRKGRRHEIWILVNQARPKSRDANQQDAKTGKRCEIEKHGLKKSRKYKG